MFTVGDFVMIIGNPQWAGFPAQANGKCGPIQELTEGVAIVLVGEGRLRRYISVNIRFLIKVDPNPLIPLT